MEDLSKVSFKRFMVLMYRRGWVNRNQLRFVLKYDKYYTSVRDKQPFSPI
jgi:hypothetical protein